MSEKTLTLIYEKYHKQRPNFVKGTKNCCFTNANPKSLQHAQTRWLFTCLVTAIPSARQTGNVKHECRWSEEAFTDLIQLPFLPLSCSAPLDFTWLPKVLVTTTAMWEQEQGLCWTQAAVGTMDATTPTPAPGPVPAGIHLGTWGCRSAGLNAPYPTTRSWVPSLLTRLTLPIGRPFSAATHQNLKQIHSELIDLNQNKKKK